MTALTSASRTCTISSCFLRNRFYSCTRVLRSEDKSKAAPAADASTDKQQNQSTPENEIITKDGQEDIVVATKDKGWKGPIQYMKDSHLKIVKGASDGRYCYPDNLNKIALLWASYYPTRDHIPPYISAKQQMAADDKLRVVILYWIMAVATFYLFTIVILGKMRIKKYHQMITDKQNRVWAAMEVKYRK